MEPGIHILLLSTGDEVITFVRSFENAYVVVEYPHRIITDFNEGMLSFEFVPLIFGGNMGLPLKIYRKHIVAQTEPDMQISGLYQKQMDILNKDIERSALLLNSFRGDNK
jgi:hypothetical protein